MTEAAQIIQALCAVAVLWVTIRSQRTQPPVRTARQERRRAR